MHPARHPLGQVARREADTAAHRPPGPWSRFAGVRGTGAVGREWQDAAAEVDAALAAWRATADALLEAVRHGDPPVDTAELEALCTARRAALDRAVARQRAARNRVLDRWLRRDRHGVSSIDHVGRERVEPSREDGVTGIAQSGPV